MTVIRPVVGRAAARREHRPGPAPAAFRCGCPTEIASAGRGRKCRRCGGVVVPEACRRALAAFRAAGARGMTRAELERADVPFAGARVRELTDMGYRFREDRLPKSGQRRWTLVFEISTVDVGRTIDHSPAAAPAPPAAAATPAGGSSASRVDGAPGADRLFELPTLTPAPAAPASHYSDPEAA